MEESVDIVNADRLNRLAQDLVRIASINPPGDVEACVDRLMAHFESHGIRGRRLSKCDKKPNFVVEIGRGSPVVLWNGHLDVVTAGTEKWQHDPFAGVIEEGFLYGRGAVDMKGPVAAMAEAFLMLASSGRELKGTLKMTAVSDEEKLGPAGTRFLAETGELNADMAIVGEPTNLEVQIMQRGVMWFDIITRGHTSHGSRPQLGVNAVEHMIDLAKAIKDQLTPILTQRTHPLVSSPSISFTKFQGGEKVNVIPDYCIMSGDRRILPGESEEDIVAEIETVLDSFRNDGYRIEFNVNTFLLPTEISPDHHIVSALRKNIERVSGEKSSITGKDAGTDAYVIGGQLNIPTVLFGPGDYRFSHRPNERISLEQMAQAARINFLTLMDLLS